MTSALRSIVNCDILGSEKNHQNTCLGHTFSKAYLYGTTNEVFCTDLTYVSIKTTQGYLQKCIPWPKQFEESGQQWRKICVEFGLAPRKLNTPMKTK